MTPTVDQIFFVTVTFSIIPFQRVKKAYTTSILNIHKQVSSNSYTT
ncbi:unnamed protein product [Schistosoma mattheei]|uniref:Uncharacterized protein n=1 Tax=Schistosoma mattheei TaxID=31246 RepID=A0A3P8K8F5_9TREM|nr:unnamed protein product [Schistosoma mattheei]